jgi:hypothetical protein
MAERKDGLGVVTVGESEFCYQRMRWSDSLKVAMCTGSGDRPEFDWKWIEDDNGKQMEASMR